MRPLQEVRAVHAKMESGGRIGQQPIKRIPKGLSAFRRAGEAMNHRGFEVFSAECRKNAALPNKPPCACSECGDWIEETDFYRMDGMMRPICTVCYDLFHSDSQAAR